MLTYAEVCELPDTDAIAYMQGLSSKERIELLATISEEQFKEMATYPFDVQL